jgi:hypothetical protein
MSTYIVSNNSINAQWGLFSGVKNKEKSMACQKKLAKDMKKNSVNKSTYVVNPQSQEGKQSQNI